MQKDCFCERSIQKLSSDQYAMVSIIISNYNGEKHLRECLSSLMQLDYLRYEVIVIDAASTDSSIAIIERDFPKVRLIKKGKIGIGEAINYGISIAQGEIIVFDLNNDDIVDKKWLINLVRVLNSSPNIGVVCGKRLKYGTNRILDSAGGGRISFLTGRTPVTGANEPDSKVYDYQKEVEWAPVITTRRSILREIGLVDPDYYIYYEDSDFSLRVARSGYKIVFVPSAVYWHKGSSTVGQHSRIFHYYMYRNQIRFILKNYPFHFMILALFYSLIFQNLYDLPILVPPIMKTLTKFTPFYKEYAWVKNDLMLFEVRKAAILWNVKNLKNTIAARYHTKH
jgi:GT2 family glycosyltransferase